MSSAHVANRAELRLRVVLGPPRKRYDWVPDDGDPGTGVVVERLPAGSTRSPESFVFGRPTLAEDVGERLQRWANSPASGQSVGFLSGIDPVQLSDPIDQIHYLQACDRASAMLAAMTASALTAVAGTQPHKRHYDEKAALKEIAVARGTGPVATESAVDVARDLAAVFTDTRDRLAAGEISYAHVKVLSEGTLVVQDTEVKRLVEAEVLPLAHRMTAWQFRTAVAAAVCTHDHDHEVTRHRKARNSRRVISRPGDHGMGSTIITDTWPRISAIQAHIDAAARQLQLSRGGATAAVTDPDAYLDTCRADALAAMILGTEGQGDTSPVPVGEPRTPTLVGQLVIDLHTLQGLNNKHCLLDGQPIPAAIGRDLARGIASWRRMVTDPVTGHLLDYGTSTYLPEPLRRYIGARDRICRAPYCNAPAARCEMDHATAFPRGPSDTTNTGLLCRCTDHTLKTEDSFWGISNSKPDGSATFTTPSGQVIHIPPREYLHTPDPPPTPERPPIPEEPPF